MEKHHKYRGLFITFEGAEGSGKSTQIELLQGYLKQKQKDVVIVREPGGVAISEKIRAILLDVNHTRMSDQCEMLLYMAARAQLVSEVLLPALSDDKIVLCDRYIDSTLAYQGYGNGIDLQSITRVGAFATQSLRPDLTIVFDLPVRTGLGRIEGRKDRIEQRNVDYHQRVREGYLTLARREPDRIKVIQVNTSREEIHARVRQLTDALFE
ncbi:MAG: dTMP kinase [Candidatus Omnitrophica bacterium]|nr:dTMP kinase [Candidatus Omnitrophota bacterium]